MVLNRIALTSVCFLPTHPVAAYGPRVTRISQGVLNGFPFMQRRTHLQQRHGGAASNYHNEVDVGGTKEVFALDFDGVICDSVGESSRSGFKAVKNFWPEVVSELEARQGSSAEEGAPPWFVEKMKELRPVVETGYENILLGRLLIEEKLGTTPATSYGLLESWGPAARDDVMQRYGVDRDSLVEAFGTARDDWMASDFQGWLGANGFYEGMRKAVLACSGEIYVVTTKQQRFARALLEHAGLHIPEERIFGLGSGPKVDVLAELKARHSGSTIHFLEDRVETLEAVCDDKRLEDLRLYLCAWGFNTDEHRSRGETNARIQVIGLDDAMGVLGRPP